MELTPGQMQRVEVLLPEGSAATVVVQQDLGSVEVRWENPAVPGAGDGRSNLAGLESKIRVRLISSAGGPERISLQNRSTSKGARLSIHLEEVHASTPEDRKEAEAEGAFGHAESLRAARVAALYPEAVRSYDAAIERWRSLGSKSDAARALTWKAMFLFVNENDARAALVPVEEAVEDRQAMDEVEAANAAKTSGYIHVQLALYKEGREEYESALHSFEKTHDVFNQEVLLDNLSRLERLQGETDAALRDAQRASALADEIGDVRGQLKIQAEIGAIDISASRLEAAYVAYQKALSLLQRAPDPATEGYVWSDLGVLYTLMHEFGNAHAALDQAMALWKRTPDPTGEINTLDDYGELWMGEHDLERARRYYRQGLALATAHSLPRAQIYLLRGLGADALMDNRPAEARKDLEQALALALQTKEGDGLPEIYCLLGDLHARTRERDRAERDYTLCGQATASTHNAYNSIRALGSLARLKLEEGDVEAAAKYSEQALSGIERVRSAIPEQELRTSFFSSMRAYYDLAVTILERLDRLHPGDNYQWQAFLTAERARARMLLDEVADGGEAGAKASPALLAQLHGVDDALRQNQRRLAANTLSLQKRREIRSTVVQLTMRRDALSAESATAEGSASAEPLTLAGIEGDLPGPHSVLLEYWTGSRGSFLWAISPTGIRSFPLPSTKVLEGHAAALLRAIRAIAVQDATVTAEERVSLAETSRQQSQREVSTLRSMLLPAGAVPRNAEAVLVVGDGPVLSIPFAVIVRSQGRQAAPVAAKCDLVMEPSASFLGLLLARPAVPHRPARIAVFGTGLETAGDAAAQRRKPAPGEPTPTGVLPFAMDEVKSIQAIFGPENSHVVPRDGETPDAIRVFPWDAFTIGHFATHAILNRENMQLTGIALGDSAKTGAGAAQDSTLWYGDICRLQTRLELVVLSACDTASGKEVPGEGLVGLSQAFFTAGSQRVLGTLWPVDDEATSSLMRWFYLYLQSTHSPATALRMAQDKMAQTPAWRSPYYWAGFSLAGDWRELP